MLINRYYTFADEFRPSCTAKSTPATNKEGYPMVPRRQKRKAVDE